jgi:plastocyanin
MRKLAFLVFLAACGGGGDDDGAAPDATVNNDVVSVDCSTVTPAATISTSGFAYDPVDSQVNADDVVEFAPMIGHDVNDEAAPPEFHVDFGATACFRFHTPGTYHFKCSAHLFEGSLTVQ